MLTPISLFSFVAVSRGFHLTHTDIGICMGSWVAVEPNGTELPSSLSLGWLGAWPRHHPELSINIEQKQRLQAFPKNTKKKTAPILGSASNLWLDVEVVLKLLTISGRKHLVDGGEVLHQ